MLVTMQQSDCLHANSMDKIPEQLAWTDSLSSDITKELVDILRACTYSITDRNAFTEPPASEIQVHRRIEAVLRCIFPDLLHKPRLAKAIKNFEPDTGLPSKRTLIEYKFLAENDQAKVIADEVLADTQGYTSKDWDHFIYVIYETTRIKPEHQWKQLLSDCGSSQNTEIIVLTGEKPTPKSK